MKNKLLILRKFTLYFVYREQKDDNYSQYFQTLKLFVKYKTHNSALAYIYATIKTHNLKFCVRRTTATWTTVGNSKIVILENIDSNVHLLLIMIYLEPLLSFLYTK